MGAGKGRHPPRPSELPHSGIFLRGWSPAVLLTGGVLLIVAMGPGQGVRQVDSLALSLGFERDSTLFARAGNRMYRSTNAGASGRQVAALPPGYSDAPPLFLPLGQTSDLPGNSRSVMISPAFQNDNTLFAFRAYDPRRVYRSTDGGVTWKQVLDRYASSVAISPAFETDRTLFAATGKDDVYGVYRSTDGGDTWEQVNGGLSYNWAAKPAFALGVGFAILLGGAILLTRYTGGLSSITGRCSVLWLAAGLEVSVLLLTTCYTLGAPALLVRGFDLQLTALVGLGLFILALLVVGFVPSIRDRGGK